MYTWILLCFASAGAISQFTTANIPDVCSSGNCLVHDGDEWREASLHMLQKGTRVMINAATAGATMSARHNINTTQIMASDSFQGFRWISSRTTASCQSKTAAARQVGSRLSLQACKSSCLKVSYCMAIDFHNVSGMCSMYTTACDKPADVETGSSSYRLQLFMKSAETQSIAHQRGLESMAIKGEPEEKKEEEKETGSESEEEGTGEAATPLHQAKIDAYDELYGDHRKNEFENEYMMEQVVAAVAASLIFVFIVTHMMHRRHIHLLPEAAMIILQGVFLGYVLRYWADSTFMRDSQYRSEMSIKLLNLGFLPLLMFESGWSVRRLDFISQFPYIMIFAVVGTLISTYAIGMMIYKSGQVEWHSITHYRSAFCIASLISTTDPVATLATYSNLKVDPLLNIIVFGEAAINDAVGIVVFSIVNDDETMASFTGVTDMLITGSYKGLKILSCSFALGLFVSSVICWSLKYFRMRENKKLEIMIIITSCYSAFALGEYFEVSGIICTLFSGMLTGQYARPHLSTEGSLLTSFVISQMCMVMDAGVFLLSGVCCVCLSWNGKTLGYCLMLFCAIGRICSTIPCGLTVNWMKNRLNAAQRVEDRHLLGARYLFMIWHAGLRGGIAENLAMQIGPWLNDLEGPTAKEAIRSSVFLVVCSYVMIFGGTTRFFLKFFSIPMGSDYDEEILSGAESGMEDSRFFNFLHFKVFQPLLVGRAALEDIDDINPQAQGKDVEDLLKEVTRSHRNSKPQPTPVVDSGGGDDEEED